MELKEREFLEYSCVSRKADTTLAFRWSAEGWGPMTMITKVTSC